ncbi:MAG: hypothetical protein GWP59_06070 [Chlamydiales bacterium]|nr:hypothetical protein [Chlamydiales bacterium]
MLKVESFDSQLVEKLEEPLAFSKKGHRSSKVASRSVEKFDIASLPGYQRKKNIQRWDHIFEQLAKDAKRSSFTVADYGSERGAFSLATAKTFTSSKVFSFESEEMAKSVAKKHKDRFRSPIELHQAELKKHRVGNNEIIRRRFHKEDFSKANNLKLHFDYQYALSIFHWLDINSPKAFDKAFSEFVKNANTTFFEMISVENIGIAMGDKVHSWYGDLYRVSDLFERALSRHKVKAKVTRLCCTDGRWLYRIDLDKKQRATTANKVATLVKKIDLSKKV